jgi:tyrosinase
MASRKNQAALTNAEWAIFIDAINKTHGVGSPAPTYRDFVKIHMQAMDLNNPTGMSWGVHTMGRMMRGRNFLAWHRQYILRLEMRLQQINSSIAIPYWDSIANPSLPKALSGKALLKSWGVTRAFNPRGLPVLSELQAINSQTRFSAFQTTLESTLHADVHNAVGGDMAGSSSPSDPLFWLHHANIDRLWAAWQIAHPGKDPSNGNETLQPKPLFGVKVSSLLDITTLGYNYV